MTPAEKESKKCAHPACQCQAAEGSRYCCDYCKAAADTLEIRCNCGHPGCE